jgi:hypothetical protein
MQISHPAIAPWGAESSLLDVAGVEPLVAAHEGVVFLSSLLYRLEKVAAAG